MQGLLRLPRYARRILAFLIVTLLTHGPALAQAASRVTVKVPMRDGVLLATDLYLPAGEGPWPVALARTPYDKNDFRNNGGHGGVPSVRLTNNAIALVVQDVRGRGASEGKTHPAFADSWGERQDSVDTAAWIRQQPWSNGKIATFGGSYLRITQLALAGAGPEGLVGQYVRVAPSSLYHHGILQDGVYRKGWLDAWLGDWPQIIRQTWRQHPHYDDYWRDHDLGTRPDQVRWPIFFLSGWFDVFSQGTIDAFTQVQEKGGDGARGRQHLVIGPWDHGIWTGGYPRTAGAITFPANAAKPPGVVDTLAWLSFWLKGQLLIPAEEPAVRYYVMGDVSDPRAPGNVWRAADRWPPPSRPLRLYFSAEGRLEPQPAPTVTTREYDYDPARPVPSRGGQNIFIESGPLDQRPVEGRPDVLVFSTPPLTEPREITGRVSVRLYAATSAPDTDFTAKLTDVYPDGRSMLVTDGIVRTRYRRSLESEEPITPGARYAYDIDLWSTSIVFNRGHQIRVTISSSNSPRFERNSNTGGAWPFDLALGAVVAHQTITLGGSEASHILLPEIVGGGAP